MLNSLEVLSNVAIKPALFLAKDNAVKLFIGRSFVFIAANSLAITSIGIIALAIFVVYKWNKPCLKLNIHVNQENSIFGLPSFPEDVFNEVLKQSRSDLVSIACVSKQFDAFTKSYVENNPIEESFGLKEWEHFNANPGFVPPIPLKLFQNFNPSNWILTFIPETINGDPITLSSIDKYVSDCKNSPENFISNYSVKLRDLLIERDNNDKFKAHWVMLSKDFLDGTGKYLQPIPDQKQFVVRAGFDVPYLKDVIVSLFMHHLKTGEYLLPDKATIVSNIKEFKPSLLVGYYSDTGLYVGDYDPFMNIGACYSFKTNCRINEPFSFFQFLTYMPKIVKDLLIYSEG